MSFNHGLRAVAPFALAAVALGMTACAPQATEPTPAVTVTASVEESTSTEPTPETSESAVKTPEQVENETPATETSTGPNDESGIVDVTVEGDQGILALQHSGTVPAGDAGPTNQKLITGPGGCFAVTNQGKPQLLVFPADATFVLQEGKPSATFAGKERFVGQQFGVATTAVSKASVAGVPDRCLQGSDDTVLVVN